MNKPVLQRTATASGLIGSDELEQVLAELRAESGGEAVSDELLGKRLVSLGKLNAWQVEQLGNGRTKFSLGPYHVIDSIGQGGMGQVFKAEHTIMGRIVAVKVLPRSKSTPEAIANFRREIRTQAQLDHENLVRAFDAGQDGNVHFLVTEYVPGTDLRKLIRANGPLSMQQASSVISQAARGLGHAHGRGLIHRDVKPANVLVSPDGRVKVSDLGLAGYFNDPEQTDQYGGKVVGTADYLAPELIMKPDALDTRSDIYSLGCTLYYAVTGKVPFPGGTMRDKARAHCQQPPLDPRRLVPELSDKFVEVIADMMAKRPEDRIGTAMDVIERLEPWAGAGSVVAPLVAEPVTPVFPQAVRKTIPSPIGDTEPYFLVQPFPEPLGETSTSQMSLGTHLNTTADETLPSFTSRSNLFPRSSLHQSSDRHMRVVMLILAVMVVMLLSVVAISMIHTMLTG